MIYMIAVIKHIAKRSGKEKFVGVRLFGTDALNVRDIPIKQFIESVVRGVRVENVRLENGDIKLVDFDMKKIPVVYNDKQWNKNTLNKCIFNIGEGEYLVVDYKGQCQRHNDSTVKKLILAKEVVNPGYYIPPVHELTKKQRIIDTLTNGGCSRVEVSDTCELLGAVARDNCDLVLIPEISKVSYGAIVSSTGRFNSIKLVRNATNMNTYRLRSMITLPMNVKITINKLIIQGYQDIVNIFTLDRNGHTDLILDYDLNSQAYDTVRNMVRYGSTYLSDYIENGSLTVHVRPEHRLTINSFEEVLDTIKNMFELVKEINVIEHLDKRVGVNGGKSLAQLNARRFVEYLRVIFTDELYNKLLDSIDNLNWDIDDIIKNEYIIKYPQYGGACIYRGEAIVQCSRVKLTKKQEFNDGRGVIVSYVDSESCEKRTCDYSRLDADLKMEAVPPNLNYILLGINKNIKDDLAYCVIKLQKSPNGATMYGGIENFSLIEVVSILEKGNLMAKGKLKRVGDYLAIESMADISIFDYNIIDKLIENSKSKQLKRLESMTGLLGADPDFDITALGLLTSVKTHDLNLKIPNAVKEIAPKAFTSVFYESLELPEGIKPITKKVFETKGTTIHNLIVHDNNNAYNSLKLIDKATLVGVTSTNPYGYLDLEISKIVYKPATQEDLYKFLIKVWNKDIFHKHYNIIEFDSKLDTDNTTRLIECLMIKSKFAELVKAIENNDSIEASDIRKHYRHELGCFRKCLDNMADALDKGIVRAIKLALDLSIIY